MDFTLGRIVKLFTIFLFLGGSMGVKAQAHENGSAPYVKYANEIIRSFTDEMNKEYGVVCIGSGGGMPYDVEEITVEFISYQKATIEQARELEVKATERLLKIINGHEKIRPFLREYLFKANRAEVAISFRNKDNDFYSDGSIARVTQIRNKIYYRKYSLLTDQLQPLAEEPYEEALIKVRKSTQK